MPEGFFSAGFALVAALDPGVDGAALLLLDTAGAALRSVRDVERKRWICGRAGVEVRACVREAARRQFRHIILALGLCVVVQLGCEA